MPDEETAGDDWIGMSGEVSPAGLNLKFWVLCEGYSDCVAKAIHEQRTYADSALHAAILSLSSLQPRHISHPSPSSLSAYHKPSSSWLSSNQTHL